MTDLINMLTPRGVSAEARFDGYALTLLFKPYEAERLLNHLQEDIGTLEPVLPKPMRSLVSALTKALARTTTTPLWKSEQGCFAWQRSAQWIELKLHTEEFKSFVESATAMPRHTRNPGPPSAEAERRWPCLSDITLLVEMMPAMYQRQAIRPGRTTRLEFLNVFSD